MGRNADAYLYTTVGPVDDESQTTRMVAKRIVSGAMSRSRDWVGAKQTFCVFIPAKTPCIINVHVYLWINFENKFSFPPFSRETQMRGGTCRKWPFRAKSTQPRRTAKLLFDWFRSVWRNILFYFVYWTVCDEFCLTKEKTFWPVFGNHFISLFSHTIRDFQNCSPISTNFSQNFNLLTSNHGSVVYS